MGMLYENDDTSEDDIYNYYPAEEQYSIFYTQLKFECWLKWFRSNQADLNYHDPMSYDSPMIYFSYKKHPNIYLSYWNGYLILTTFEDYRIQRYEFPHYENPSRLKPMEMHLLHNISQHIVGWIVHNDPDYLKPWIDKQYLTYDQKLKNLKYRAIPSLIHDSLVTVLRSNQVNSVSDRMLSKWLLKPEFRFKDLDQTIDK